VVMLLALWGLAPRRVQGSFLTVIGVTLMQDGLGTAVVTTGMVWLTIPLLVLGLRRVPLAKLSLAGVLAGALAWAWARS